MQAHYTVTLAVHSFVLLGVKSSPIHNSITQSGCARCVVFSVMHMVTENKVMIDLRLIYNLSVSIADKEKTVLIQSSVFNCCL